MQRENPNRRDFLKTASTAALSALTAGCPRRLPADETHPQAKSKATADAVIVLWMAGGMAHTETFDPKRYTPYAPGTPSERRSQHVSGDRYRSGQYQVFAGTGENRRGHGQGNAHSLVHRRRSGLHSAFAASVSCGTRAMRLRRPSLLPHIGAVIARTLGPRQPRHAGLH